MRGRRQELRAWPPTPYPPREPNPNGDDLLDPIDWMTFSHRDLHLMATTRLNLETARELSGDWLRVGRKLDEIADKLTRLNRLTHGAWEGAAAEVARHTGSQLSTWAEESGNGARGVADYLDRHASNAEWASREMPEPDRGRGLDWLPNWRRDDPDAGPDAGPTGPKPAASGSGQIDFAAARVLVEDEGEARERRQREHRRAAEVMARMQANAAEIFGTVPRFTTPAIAARQSVDPAGDVMPCPADDRSFGATTAAGYAGPSSFGTAGGGPETQTPGARPWGSGPERMASGIPGGAMTSGNPGTAVSAAAASDSARARGPVGFGAVPLGRPAAAGRGDTERRSSKLVGGDASLFEPDNDPAPDTVAADYDETPRSPWSEPLPPISLDRLPGTWVRAAG